ncbi:fimbrial protein [Serratia ureilytica]|jgi:type 1 fimbria pilin|uniref:fimbrial protein n=1 Tax=Serratia TaxID=613 RepID=UPI0018D33390|nr:fimbrial protein [Serratia ureilytica]MBH1913713.1 fimbrial protein [Serratia ureilytica]MBH2516914.1 fimbrial protein [Serratia ureilytica]MBH2533131.1 fimbrial protein [Serratia ureilytica]BEL97240.1 fimbrial protein SteE [Serratia marcescens]
MKRRNRRHRVLGAILLVGILSPAWAGTPLTVKVTILAPLPCEINGGKPIEVDFGDEVLTTRINGSNYKTLVDYSISCKNPGKNAMMMQIAGTPTTFDGSALKTNFGGLGIVFFQDGVKVKLNSWQNFTYSSGNPPKLEAAPVKLGAATLPEGAFTASATLRVDYQ